MSSDFENKIYSLVATHFNKKISDLSHGTSFQKDLRADSLEVVSLLVTIEDEFNFKMSDADAVKIKTIGDAIGFAKNYLKS